MKRGNLKPKSAYNKFAKTQEHARWAKEYTKPDTNGISETDKAYLAHLYTPQGQIFTKIMEQLDKEAE